jgi:hypothetical protein
MIYKISWFFKATSHYLTLFILRFYQQKHQVVFVCGSPRSGTSWVSDVLAFYYNLPRPKHYILPVVFESVIHTHQILDIKKYKECFFVIREGKNSFLSQYYMIKKLILQKKNFVGKNFYVKLFKDVSNEDNTSHNVLLLMKEDSKKSNNLFKRNQKILEYKLNVDNSIIIYEDALKNPIDTFAKAITSNSGECDYDRLQLVLDLLSKKAQNKLPGKRKSTVINKVPSDAKNVFEKDALDYYNKMMSK